MKVVLFLLLISICSVACGLGPDLSKDRVPRSPSPTPFIPEKPIADYLRDGNTEYTAGNFAEAIDSYKQAFEIEKREQKLEKKERNELVANLAMAYVRTGDTTKARVTIAYGVSKDFEYAMFHYILAASYGVEGDESSALYRLRTAYKFRDKLPAGTKLPDPLSDPTFESFAGSETFKKAVEDAKRSRPGTKK